MKRKFLMAFCLLMVACLCACESSHATKTQYITGTIVEEPEKSVETTQIEKEEKALGFDTESRELTVSYRKSPYVVPCIRNLADNNSALKPSLDVDTNMGYSTIAYSEAELDVYKTILEAVKKRETHVDIPVSYQMSMETVRSLMVDMSLAEAEAYAIDMDSLNFRVEEHGTDLIVFAVDYELAFDTESIEEWDNALKELSGYLKEIVPPDTSDYDKLVFVHDFIIYNNTYAEVPNEHTSSVVGGLIKGYGDCQSFAKAFTYLSKELGVYATNIVGKNNNVGHMWNAAYCDGVWTIIDVGMDNVDNNNVLDWATHGFFGITQEYAENNTLHYFNTPQDMYYLAHPDCISESHKFYDVQGYNYRLTNVNDKELVKKELAYIIDEAFKKDPQMNYVEFTLDTESVSVLESLYFYKDSEFLTEFSAYLTDEVFTGREVLNIAFVTQKWNNSVIIYIQSI